MIWQLSLLTDIFECNSTKTEMARGDFCVREHSPWEWKYISSNGREQKDRWAHDHISLCISYFILFYVISSFFGLCVYSKNTIGNFSFLSDPGIPCAWSTGPSNTFVRFKWCDSVLWRYQFKTNWWCQSQAIWQCKQRHQVDKFFTNGSGTSWWQNLESLQVAPPGSQIFYSSDNSNYGFNPGSMVSQGTAPGLAMFTHHTFGTVSQQSLGISFTVSWSDCTATIFKYGIGFHLHLFGLWS